MTFDKKKVLTAAMTSGVLTAREYRLLQLSLDQYDKGSDANQLAASVAAMPLLRKLQAHLQTVVDAEKASEQ